MYRLAIRRMTPLLIALLLPLPIHAGFWQKLDAFFSVPPLPEAYQGILAEAGWTYLQQKDDVFDARAPLGPPSAAVPPEEEPLDEGGSLVEVWGLQDMEVAARVDYDSGLGYAYSAGDALVIRLYTAALVRLNPDGEVLDSRARVLALRNRDNPANRDGEVSLIRELQSSAPFTEEERSLLIGGTDPRIP